MTTDQRTTPEWLFYGTAAGSPQLQDLLEGLSTLGVHLDARPAPGEPADRTHPEAPLLPNHVVLTNGAPGGLLLNVSHASRPLLAPYQALSLPLKPPARSVATVARLVPTDAGLGDTYQHLTRPVLCVLGELFPRGVTVRVGRSDAFPTDNMRRRFNADQRQPYRVGGSFQVDRTRLAVATQRVQRHWLLRRLVHVDGARLLIMPERLELTEDEWGSLYPAMRELASFAHAGRADISREGEWDATLHATGALPN